MDYEAKSSYSVTVRVTDGEDAGGNGEDAPAVDETIEVTNVEEPRGGPTGVTTEAALAASLSVRWTPPGDSGALPVAGYELRWLACGRGGPGGPLGVDGDRRRRGGDGGDGRESDPDTAYWVRARARGATESASGRAAGPRRTSGGSPDPGERDDRRTRGEGDVRRGAGRGRRGRVAAFLPHRDGRRDRAARRARFRRRTEGGGATRLSARRRGPGGRTRSAISAADR